MSLLNPRWKYTPSTATDIRETLRKHGFKATTDAERKARQLRGRGDDKFSANVTPINRKSKS